MEVLIFYIDQYCTMVEIIFLLNKEYNKPAM